MIAYSLRLKAIVLLDVLVLAGGYALRLVAGGFAVDIQPSPWLLAFCVFLFFSLALVKRYAELALLKRRDGPQPMRAPTYLTMKSSSSSSARRAVSFRFSYSRCTWAPAISNAFTVARSSSGSRAYCCSIGSAMCGSQLTAAA